MGGGGGERLGVPVFARQGFFLFFFFLKKARRGGNLTSDPSALRLNQRSQTQILAEAGG